MDYILLSMFAFAAIAIPPIMFIEFAYSRDRTVECRVIEKHYSPARDFTVMCLPASAPEERTLVLDRDGEIIVRKVSAKTFAKAEPGRMMSFTFRVSGMSGKMEY